MRVTLTLDRDVYEAAMRVARGSGQRLGKVISAMARRGLSREAPPFPVVEIPPGTPMITASRVQRFLDEEGYF
jgi:hypothetical protein